MKMLQTRFHIAAQQNHITLQTGREPYVCICSCNSTKLAVNENMNSNTKPTCPHQALASRLDHRLLSDAVSPLALAACWHAHTRHAPREPAARGSERGVPCQPPRPVFSMQASTPDTYPLPYVSPLSPPIYGVLAGGLPTSLLRLPVLPRKAPRSIHRPLLHRLRHARTHARTG